jgi:hypothetical protein
VFSHKPRWFFQELKDSGSLCGKTAGTAGLWQFSFENSRFFHDDFKKSLDMFFSF